jgi:hypothetical protein
MQSSTHLSNWLHTPRRSEELNEPEPGWVTGKWNEYSKEYSKQKTNRYKLIKINRLFALFRLPRLHQSENDKARQVRALSHLGFGNRWFTHPPVGAGSFALSMLNGS